MINITNRGIFFVSVFLLFLFSCTTPPQNLYSQGLSDERQKVPDRRVQADCKGKPFRSSRDSRSGYGEYTGPLCGESNECALVCDEIFSSGDKKECFEYPPDNIYRIQTLLSDAEEGILEDDFSLKCLLDISDRQIINAFRELAPRKAQDVLIDIAADGDLAEIFADEDTNYNILNVLLREATGRDTIPFNFVSGIDGQLGFIHLASKGEEAVWRWLDSYVTVRAGSQSAIYEYCKAISSMGNVLIEELINGENFKDLYQGAIENAGARIYDANGAKTYCDSIGARGSLSNFYYKRGFCPHAGIPVDSTLHTAKWEGSDLTSGYRFDGELTEVINSVSVETNHHIEMDILWDPEYGGIDPRRNGQIFAYFDCDPPASTLLVTLTVKDAQATGRYITWDSGREVHGLRGTCRIDLAVAENAECKFLNNRRNTGN